MSTIAINRHRGLLIKALLFVFAMHTSIGYAACCMAEEPAKAQTSMPCHNNDKANAATDVNTDTNIDADHSAPSIDYQNYCASCTAIAIPTNLSKPISSKANNLHADTLLNFISSNIAPLFRPPITHLS